MPRVLITSDETSSTPGLVEGYRAAGCEVVIGAANFRLRAATFDIVHHQWPEEFSRWCAPTPKELDAVRKNLEWWQHRAFNIFSVHNLYPHLLDRDPACHELYSYFYRCCQLITHFSNTSHRLVLEDFPAARDVRHVIHSPLNYEVTLATQSSRGGNREAMGIGRNEFVILMLGSIRSWDEVRLLQKAYDRAKTRRKRLLMAGKLTLREAGRYRRLNQMRWRWWLQRTRAVVNTRYVPETELSQFVDTCDVAIIPRLSGITSGIFNLAMTFGRLVIAPNHGAYPEYLQGTRNLLYETGSAESLAAALDKAASLDLEEIGRENARIAAGWTWKNMCATCLAVALDDKRLSHFQT